MNEGVPEWPPSPWRILRAFVAVWKNEMEEEISKATMYGILSKLCSPPLFYLPPATLAYSKHYMPWESTSYNDRTKVFDVFVAVDPNEDLFVHWPDAVLEPEESAALERILKNLPYLGRSESLCSARLVIGLPKPINCRPLTEGTEPGAGYEVVRTLAPASPLVLDALYVKTEDLRSKKMDVMSPPGTCWVNYERNMDCFIEAQQGQAEFSSARNKVTVMRFAMDSAALPAVMDAVRVGDLFRRAAMAWFGRRNGGAVSRTLSGKDENGRPLKGHAHAFYLPSDEDEDGRLDNVTIHASSGLTDQEREALGSIDALNLGGGKPPIRLILIAEGGVEDFDCSILRESAVWRSITPFVLVRHPKLRGYTAGGTRTKVLLDSPEDQVRLELKRRGLPEPEAIERLPQHEMRGHTISWLAFHRWRGRGSEAGGAYGFLIKFSSPVRGPIALGYGCHFGLGLFAGRRGEALGASEKPRL